MEGLGLANPSESSSLEYEASVTVTEPLVQRIVAQEHQPSDAADMQSTKSQAGAKKNEFLKGCEEVVQSSLRAAELPWEKGASSWLTVIPIKDQGYDLNKREMQILTANRTPNKSTSNTRMKRNANTVAGSWRLSKEHLRL